MPEATNGSIVLHYDTFGTPGDPVALLIMGLGTQMTAWPEAFCVQLAERGRQVVRFDNRDVGLSSKTQGSPPNVIALAMAAMTGSPLPEVPYLLSDMAGDAIAVLDAVGADQADIVGASMGGMIAQTVAIEHPTRIRSLTSIMSTTGARDVGQPELQAMGALVAAPPADREQAIRYGVGIARTIAGPRFDESRARDMIASAYDRSFHPGGVAFQMAAVIGSGDRTEALRGVDVPAVVIHGRADPLVTLSGGQATAAAIPGAELVVLDEMGHDLPEPLWPEIIGAIDKVASRARP